MSILETIEQVESPMNDFVETFIGMKESIGGGAEKHPDPLSTISMDKGECLGEKEVCSRKNVLALLSDFIEATGQRKSGKKPKTDARKVLEKAKSALECDSESCVVTHPDFVRFIVDVNGSDDIVKENLESNFKEFGPKNSRAWLSNESIDGTLRRWAKEFPKFYPYSFNMIDFEKEGGSLARVPLASIYDGDEYVPVANRMVKRPCRCMASVVNTDYTGNRGKHWMAVFVDCRPRDSRIPWTVEFFNSSGNPPVKEITEWMEKSRFALLKLRGEKQNSDRVETVVSSSIKHQYGDSECGVYSLFYIRKRLEGESYRYFQSKIVEDGSMVEFRKYLFRSHK